SPSALTVMSNTIFCATRQGVHAITEAGAVLVSKPIDDQWQNLVGMLNQNPALASRIFTVSKESKHYVVVAVPNSLTDPGCSQQFVFTVPNGGFNGGWTTWSKPGLQYGFSDSAGQLFFVRQDGRIIVERQAGTYLDYQDEGFTVTAPQLGGNQTLT